MDEVLEYVSGGRRSADICYLLGDGEKEKLFRKMDNREAIERAIDGLKDRGIQTIVVDVYKPNGTARVFDRSFTLHTEDEKRRSSKPLYGAPAPSLQPFESAPKATPITQQPNMESWKDYALQTERDKVAKLEAENASLKTENKSLDEKVRDFEKEMIRKDHEVENLSKTVESKTGLNGFVDKASENPAIMNMLTGLASRMLGLPAEAMLGQSALSQGSPELLNPKTDQYIANIRAWLYKQPEDLQDHFYQLVYELTNAPHVALTLEKLLNLVKNGTTTNQFKVAR